MCIYIYIYIMCTISIHRERERYEHDMNMTNMILANRSSPQAAMRTGVHLWNHQQYCCLKTHMTNPLLKTLFLDNSPGHISVSDVPFGNQTLATEHRDSQSMETSDCQVKRFKDTPLYPSLLRLKSKFACRAEIQLCVDQITLSHCFVDPNTSW